MEHLSWRDPPHSILKWVLRKIRVSLPPKSKSFFTCEPTGCRRSSPDLPSVESSQSCLHLVSRVLAFRSMRDVSLPSRRQITSQPRYQGTVTTFGFTVSRWLSSKDKHGARLVSLVTGALAFSIIISD